MTKQDAIQTLIILKPQALKKGYDWASIDPTLPQYEAAYSAEELQAVIQDIQEFLQQP